MIIQLRIIHFSFFKRKNLGLVKNSGDEPSIVQKNY
jgi:hypothetical protein